MFLYHILTLYYTCVWVAVFETDLEQFFIVLPFDKCILYDENIIEFLFFFSTPFTPHPWLLFFFFFFKDLCIRHVYWRKSKKYFILPMCFIFFYFLRDMKQYEIIGVFFLFLNSYKPDPPIKFKLKIEVWVINLGPLLQYMSSL